MSLIPDLGMVDGMPTKLPDIMETYENELIEAEANLQIKGKTLERANVENPTWQLYYDQRRSELHILLKYIEGLLAGVRGKLFRSYTETPSQILSDRAKDQYINNEPAYLSMLEIMLEIKDIHDRYQAVCDAYKSRGYALNNITKIRVASIEDAII